MMFTMMPCSFLFFFITILGTCLSLSSTHWLGIWAGLEINLIGFIPLIMFRGQMTETESGIKYLIIQALASSILMMGSLLCFSTSMTWEIVSLTSYNNNHVLLLLILVSLAMKLGMFPFHFWVPPVMAGLSWPGCAMLATWQKLAPLFLLASFIQSWTTTLTLTTLILMALISSLIGGFGGINQTQLRAILAYSSIAHTGWMAYSALLGDTVIKIYFIIYFMVSISLFLFLWSVENLFMVNNMSVAWTKTKLIQLLILTILLSLGGLPPFLGFIGKWTTIYFSTMTYTPLLIIPLILGSLLSLFYYLSLLFSLTLISSTKMTPSTPMMHPLMSQMPHPTPILITNMFILLLNLVGGVLIMFTLPFTEFMI
nr:NADH dehydrogenase subunit 2 [Notocrater youngi]